MMTLKIPLRHGGARPALPQLPDATNADNLGSLEQAPLVVPSAPRRDPRGHECEAASIEYASWLRLLRTRHA